MTPGFGLEAGEKRKYIGILYACCGVYQRVYKDECKQLYRGRCPKCGRTAEIKVGPGGTDHRFFTAC